MIFHHQVPPPSSGDQIKPSTCLLVEGGSCSSSADSGFYWLTFHLIRFTSKFTPYSTTYTHKKFRWSNEWILITTCKKLVWSTRIGRNMPTSRQWMWMWLVLFGVVWIYLLRWNFLVFWSSYTPRVVQRLSSGLKLSIIVTSTLIDQTQSFSSPSQSTVKKLIFFAKFGSYVIVLTLLPILYQNKILSLISENF